MVLSKNTPCEGVISQTNPSEGINSRETRPNRETEAAVGRSLVMGTAKERERGEGKIPPLNKERSEPSTSEWPSERGAKPQITAMEIIQGPRSSGPKARRGRSIGSRFTGIRANPLSPPPMVPPTAITDEEQASTPADEGRSEEEYAERIRVESSDSEEEYRPLPSLSGATKRARGRGRPATTGKGVLSRETRASRRRLNDLEREIEIADEILEGDFDPRECRLGPKEAAMEAKMEEEVRAAPSQDIAAELLKTANKVKEIAAKFRNLRGTYMKTLKDCARYVRVAADALANRALGAPTHQDGEREREVTRLREELRQVKGELSALKNERERSLMP